MKLKLRSEETLLVQGGGGREWVCELGERLHETGAQVFRKGLWLNGARKLNLQMLGNFELNSAAATERPCCCWDEK